MPNNNNNNNKNKQKKKQFESEVKQLFGNDLTQEIRQLIDLAVRKQFNSQDFVERLVNTHYFHRSFPGLMEHNGTIANALTGEQGVGVSASTLAGAIKNYRTALSADTELAHQYGFHNFGRDQLAKLLDDNTSSDEFAARLKAVEIVDANPELKQAYEAQLRASGTKVTPNAAYKAAMTKGDNAFTNAFEGALFQQQLGLSRTEAHNLTQNGPFPVGTDFNDIGTLVSEVRNNLQGYAPELANQGINTAQLVKILGNPTAYAPELDKIKAIAQQRQQQYGTPVAGTYPQQGPSGGFSQYGVQREQRYG